MDKNMIFVREAAPGDLDGIFSLYYNYMFDSYLVKSGSLLVKEYLKVMLKSKNCITLVAEGGAAGFIMAAANAKKMRAEIFFNRRIFREWMKRVFSNPAFAFASLELLAYPSNTRAGNTDAELLFIAVEPACRTQGLATRLITEVLRSLRARGIKKVKVSTHVGNAAINRLLAQLGFEIKKTFMLFNKRMYLHDRELAEEPV